MYEDFCLCLCLLCLFSRSEQMQSVSEFHFMRKERNKIMKVYAVAVMFNLNGLQVFGKVFHIPSICHVLPATITNMYVCMWDVSMVRAGLADYGDTHTSIMTFTTFRECVLVHNSWKFMCVPVATNYPIEWARQQLHCSREFGALA